MLRKYRGTSGFLKKPAAFIPTCLSPSVGRCHPADASGEWKYKSQQIGTPVYAGTHCPKVTVTLPSVTLLNVEMGRS